MGRLIVVTTPELEPGYRLAGVATRSLDSAGEAAELLHELLEQPERGRRRRRARAVLQRASCDRSGARIDSLASPLVVVLPGGEGADVEAERRAQHLRILWEAVGYQITFDRKDDST